MSKSNKSIAEKIWRRAEQASRERHIFVARREFRLATRMGQVKAECVTRAISLDSRSFAIGVHYVNGLKYWHVVFRGQRALHLPLHVRLPDL